MNKPELIHPEWPAPPGVRAVSTTRRGGLSTAPWNSFNLGHHVGDDPAAVAGNRKLLQQAAGLPGPMAWLEQVHGTRIALPGTEQACADGRFTDRPGEVCAVLTADCLPVLLCNRSGTAVAAVHAGWRGLLAGVVEAAIHCFPDAPSAIIAWLGPAIGPGAFEVGAEVVDGFVQEDSRAAGCFRPVAENKWLADLYGLARLRLARAGVSSVHGGGFCTFTDQARFFSYRRDGRTGRMATLIWRAG